MIYFRASMLDNLLILLYYVYHI